MNLDLDLLSASYAVCRLAPGLAVPAWAETGDLVSITRTTEELSIVCPQDQLGRAVEILIREGHNVLPGA